MSNTILSLLGTKATFKKDEIFLKLDDGTVFYDWRSGDPCILHGFVRTKPDEEIDVLVLYGKDFGNTEQFPLSDLHSELAIADSRLHDSVVTPIYRDGTKQTLSVH